MVPFDVCCNFRSEDRFKVSPADSREMLPAKTFQGNSS